MGRLLTTLRLTAALAIAAVLHSCNTTGCTELRSSIPLAGFYSSETESAISLTAVQIGGVGAPDSALLHSEGSVSTIYLPLRAAQTSTSYFIHYTQEGLDDPMWNDTITFTYERVPFFASEECGAMYNYAITKFDYTTNVLDSVSLLTDVITNVDVESLKIFYRNTGGDSKQ